MTNDHPLEGCRPTPLASYLKALGVLRLVAEQKDPDAKGWWQAERFHLRTKLSQEELTAFFLNDYAPSPIIAPWNGGSGFYPKDNQSGISTIEKSATGRFEVIKASIEFGRRYLKQSNIKERPKDDAKLAMISGIRSQAPEELIHWIDAAVAVTTDRLGFPPLLGTGGNDGRLDFTNNYFQRLCDLIDPENGTARADRQLAKAALFGNSALGSVDSAVGQFAPGDAGGPNSTSGVEGDATLNPWDFVLMLEGALVIAGGVVRRFSSDDRSAASFPFTVRATGAGFGTASQPEESDARGELWAPLWSAPSGLDEVKSLFREGRIAQTRRAVRDGMDAALAIASVGADRRISGYQRYGFQKRQGLAFLATPLERRAVTPNPVANLAANLDRGRWLDRVRQIARSDRAPARLVSAVRALEEALFALAGEGGASDAAAEVIISVGEIAQAVALSKSLREDLPPPPLLRHEWIAACGDSVEVRLAAALSGLWLKPAPERGAEGDTSANRNADEFPFRFHVAPLAKEEKSGHRKKKCRTWSTDGSSADQVWTEGGLVDSMVAVALRRSIEATRTGAGGGAFGGSCRRLARLDDVAAFLSGDVDERKIAELARGFVWVDVAKKNSTGAPQGQRPAVSPSEPPPLAYVAIKPIFAPQPAADDAKRRPLKFTPTIAPLLAAGRVADAVETAMRRAQADGFAAPFKGMKPVGVDSRRLLASLLFPIFERARQSCVDRAYPIDDKERPNENAA